MTSSQPTPPAPAGDLPPVRPEAFRDALGRFATGITVMTTTTPGGGRYGVTASSFGSLSLDPPLVQWSLRNVSSSLPLFVASRSFAVNILAADQEAVSRAFATAAADRFGAFATEEGIAGLPLIHGVAAWIECSLENTLPGGDHTILVGRVLRARTFAKTPLLHWRGGYLPIAETPAAHGGQA